MRNAGPDELQAGIKIGGRNINNLRYVDVKWSEARVAQSCPTLRSPELFDPMNCIVHGILQARILEWVAFPFSRGSSQPRDRDQVPCIAGKFFTS